MILLWLQKLAAEPTTSQSAVMDMDAHFARPQGPSGPGDHEKNIMWAVAQPMISLLRAMLAGPGEPSDFSGNELGASEKKDGPATTVRNMPFPTCLN